MSNLGTTPCVVCLDSQVKFSSIVVEFCLNFFIMSGKKRKKFLNLGLFGKPLDLSHSKRRKMWGNHEMEGI